MLLMIDNYDSFTYNLVQGFEVLGAEVCVVSHHTPLQQLIALKPTQLVISPGPGSPTDAGVSLAAIQYFSGRLPLLGVCLGHQALAQAFGGRVVRSPVPMHGKTSVLKHNQRGLFAGLPQGCEVMRYHSLEVKRDSLPATFEITAEVEGPALPRGIMGLWHRPSGAVGVQFHPESIGTPMGQRLLGNFLLHNQIGFDYEPALGSAVPAANTRDATTTERHWLD